MKKSTREFILKHQDNPPSRVLVNGRSVPWDKIAPKVLGETHKDIADKEHKDEIQHDMEQTGHEPEDQDLGSGDSQSQE
jgi:hypothetical protein